MMADGPERAPERALEIAAATHPDVDLTDIDPGIGRELVPLARLAPETVEEVRRPDVDQWGRSEHFRALTRRAFEPMYKHWFRVEWEGFELLPEEGGALLVANHAGAIPPDAPSIMHGIEKDLGRPVYGLAENLFRALPVVLIAMADVQIVLGERLAYCIGQGQHSPFAEAVGPGASNAGDLLHNLAHALER